jgi:hypothetical protein
VDPTPLTDVDYRQRNQVEANQIMPRFSQELPYSHWQSDPCEAVAFTVEAG